jgi:prepilin signal peptidase PulO-like enzyme (type II secretory pathway)
MELFTGAIWVFTIVPYYIAIEQKMWIPLLYLFVLVNSLILISVYDWRYLEIPNKFSFPLIFLLIMSLFLPFTPTPQDGLLAAAILFLFFYAQILLPYFIYAFRKHKYSILKDVLILPFWFIMQIFSPHKWFENESIEEDETPDDLLEWVGFGDLRIAFVMGLVLGVKYSFFALFISYFFGAIIGVLFFRKDKEKGFNHMPFAPFLAIGTFVMLVSGNLVLALYHNYTDILSSFF